MFTISNAHQGNAQYPVRKWDELCPQERSKFGNNEQSYVDHLMLQGLAKPNSGGTATGKMKDAIDQYYDSKEYEHMKTLMETPFRVNTLVMAGISSLGVIGGMLGAATGLLLTGLGGFELFVGVKAHDRALMTDGALNMGIGALMGTAILMPFPYSLGALAIAGAREIVHRRDGICDAFKSAKEWIKEKVTR